MKKIILSIATVGMLAVGGMANAGYMSFMGWMPGTWDGIDYDAINDVHPTDIEQIEIFLGYGPDDPNTGLVFYDKWEMPDIGTAVERRPMNTPGQEGLIAVDAWINNYVDPNTGIPEGDWIGGYWQTIDDATGASVMTVKADSMIGIWAMTEIGTLAVDGEWDTYFTMPTDSQWHPRVPGVYWPDGMYVGGGDFLHGAEVSHITWWNEVGDRDRDINPPDPTIAEPASMMLFGLGLTGLGLILRRREKKIVLDN